MIGRVTFTNRHGQQSVATLNDDGVWESSDELEAAVLNVHHNPRNVDQYPQPACGTFGVLAIHEVAKHLNGKAEVLAVAEPESGEEVVY